MRPASPERGVTCPYGKEGSAWATGEHGGIDYGCPTGDPVYSMWGGIVTSASWGSAYGTQLVIDHDKLPDGSPGLWAVYAHLSGKSVSPGERVEAGQRIGTSGASGNVSGPHLHVEVQRAAHWQQGNYVDPQPWIEAGDVSYDYFYSGKPSGTLIVGQDYEYLDIDEWDPPESGLEHVMAYLNCSGFAFDGGQPGRIRVCFERNTEDSDRFGYQDFVVVPGIPELLITHATFEKGDGTRTWTMIKCMDGLRSMTVGTRYMKRSLIA